MSSDDSSSPRRSIRETIRFDRDPSYNKKKENLPQDGEVSRQQAEQLQKIEVKYQKEVLLRDLVGQKGNQQGEISEEARAAKYFDVAFADVRQLFQGIFGGEYKAKNNFSFAQKQKILSYLYFKNKTDMDSPFRVESAYGGIDQQHAQIYDIQNKLANIEKLKFDNRVVFVNQVAECSNRIRVNGYIWGFLASSFLWATALRKQSLIRKVAASLTLTHIGGQFSSYRSIDRVFDSMYPLFSDDYAKFFVEERRREKENVNAGGIKPDPIRDMLERNAIEIRESLKTISPAQQMMRAKEAENNDD